MDNIQFVGDNPGAVRYGNFINYYQFHPPENRIKVLPTHIWKECDDQVQVCLDIGCNAGKLTISLYEFLKNNGSTNTTYNFLGIDIDPILIERAEENNTTHANQIKYLTLDFMNEQQSSLQLTNYLKTYTKSRFNITFCLSITMWIHLNHGDEGLRQFLMRICQLSNFLVIEPQPWKCYKTAMKRLKQSNSTFPKFKTLENRQNVEDFIEFVLEDECRFVKIMETQPTKWGRRILFYKRTER